MNAVTATTLRPMPLLIKTVQALQAKAIKAEGKAHELWITIGIELKEAKARNKEMVGVPWAEFAKLHFDFGQSRADELIRIADGRTDVETVRASGAARVQKHAKAKSALANAGLSDDEVVERDRKTCIALYQKACAADPEFARWMAEPDDDDDESDEVYEDTPAGRRRKARDAKERQRSADALYKSIAAARELTEQEIAGWRDRGIMPAWNLLSACRTVVFHEHRPNYGAAVVNENDAPPSEDVLKFCKLPMRFVQDFSHRFTVWTTAKTTNLREDEKEALVDSIQACADEMSRLAQSLRLDVNRADEADDPDAKVTSPAVLEDNILHAISRINDNARLFNKLLKISALDREAAARIATAIDVAIGKLRSIKSTLEKKDCGAELVPAVKQAHAAPP
jgi:hypothetical protein